MAKTNDDMAGGVSEPKDKAPEVKPAKSLWPKPYGEVRVEPGLETPQNEADAGDVPPVSVPASDFETVLPEGAAPRVEPVLADEAPALEPEVSESDAAIDGPEIDGPEQEAADDSPRPDEYPEPVVPPDPEPAPDQSREPEPEVLRVSEDERTAAVFDAADHQDPALADRSESGTARFVAMAAGIVVALALGGVAFVYGASGLGLNFGSGDDTSSSAPPPEPVATAEELKAAQERIAELEARVKAAEEEKAAAEAAAKAAAEAKQEQMAALPPEPAPAAEQAAPPAPAPKPPAQAESKPEEPAPPPAAAREPEPEPASEPAAEADRPPQQLAPGPRNLDAQRPPQPSTPREMARAEPEPPPPPRYNVQPSYGQRRADPEMPVLQGWQVRDVYNGIAVVQSGRGAPMEVEPGDNLPGGNRVLAIRRLGGSWAVITERGIIAGY